jgi:hypothetical protein
MEILELGQASELTLDEGSWLATDGFLFPSDFTP